MKNYSSRPKSWATYQPNSYKGEDEVTSYGPSKTIPDQALSLQELLYNYTRGIPVNQMEGEYLGDEYIPDFASMDIADIADYKTELSEQIKDLEQRIKASEKEEFEKRKALYKKGPQIENQDLPEPIPEDLE